MGGEVEMLRERISFLEEENDNLMIEKEIALTKMEQVIFKGSVFGDFTSKTAKFPHLSAQF